MMSAIGAFLKKAVVDAAKKTLIKAAAGDKSSQKKVLIVSLIAIAPFFISIIVIITVIFGPIMLGAEYIKQMTESSGVLFDKIGNVLTLNGWCSTLDGSCAETAEQKYYQELNEVYQSYKDRNVTIDQQLITATIFYSYAREPEFNITDEDGYNQGFIDSYCEAYSVFWVGEKLTCPISVKEDYENIYNKYFNRYKSIATNYEALKKQYCLTNNFTKQLELLSGFPITSELLDSAKEELCEYFLWESPDIEQGKIDTTYILYKEGKDDIKKLAKEMVSGNRINLNNYKNYLIDTYIPKHFSSLLDPNDKEKSTKRIAEEIMMFATVKDKNSNYAGGTCSFNEQDKVNINIDTKYVDKLYIKTLQPYCYYVENCSEADVEYIVPFKEYVTGVVYREISAGLNPNISEETIKANIVAIKSYTLGRRKSIEDGGNFYITMRNNENDQVYCNLDQGCMKYSSLGVGNLKPPATNDIKEQLFRLYDEVENEYLYNTSSNAFVGAYTDSKATCIYSTGTTVNCMSQQDSISMGNNGQDYRAILMSFYTENVGLLDITNSIVSMGAYACSQTFYMGGGKYSSNAPRYDNSNDFFSNINYNYFLPPSYENYGECPWYAKGRAIEIMDKSTIPDELKFNRINFLRDMLGNGGDWYNNPSNQLFSKSTDIYAAKPGAIVSWSGGSSMCPGGCGHVGIIEDVEYDSNGKASRVLLSDGWNNYTASGTKIPSYSMRWMDMKQLRVYNLNNPNYYSGFNGYVYLLD